ncbi:MAG: hypothetical protein KDB65_09535 [Calditrichaeota bacterium]|nr:hypothetical protein [Calditrichota bacterium]MCB9369430.1 hypothetical protein [Calditrichota bacterium]
MKRTIGIIVTVALIVVLLPKLNAWDQKDYYSEDGGNVVYFTPAYSGNHYVYAYATLGTQATSQIVQNGQLRAQAHIYTSTGERAKCDSNSVQIGGGATKYESSAVVAAGGEATCIGYDHNSTYYTYRALCPQNPAQ